MKSNKKRILLVLAILTMAILLSFVFVACGNNTNKTQNTIDDQTTNNYETFNIDYDLNSGSWDSEQPFYTYTINDCGKRLPVPSRPEYIFEGWKDTDGNFVENLPSSNSLEDLSLQASWVKGTSGLIFALSTDNYWTVSGHSSSFVNVNIPKEYRGIPVNSIGSFSGCTNLTSISIPDSVTGISASAFMDCTGLTNITIPDGVMSIGDSAFSGCTGVTSILSKLVLFPKFS